MLGRLGSATDMNNNREAAGKPSSDVDLNTAGVIPHHEPRETWKTSSQAMAMHIHHRVGGINRLCSGCCGPHGCPAA